jgi:hypothetical protein
MKGQSQHETHAERKRWAGAHAKSFLSPASLMGLSVHPQAPLGLAHNHDHHLKASLKDLTGMSLNPKLDIGTTNTGSAIPMG